MHLSNRAYNVIKWTITIFLPAVGALYYALAEIWDFQRIPGVNGTINAIITFLGLLIGYSSRQYNKSGAGSDGELIINEVDGEKFPALAAKGSSLDDFADKESVTLNVVYNPETPPLPETKPHI